MKFVFFGTPEFAAIILERIIRAGFIPEAVVCNLDKPVGRKKIITFPQTKILAKKYNIPVLQPEILTNYKLQIINYKPDFFIVAAYAKILPKEILEISKFGNIGVHPSLLPKYRGTSPIQAVILNGDEETGTTLYLMDEKMDHGAIIANLKFKMQNSEWDYENLSKKLAELSADLLIENLPNIKEKIKNTQLQNESQATYTKKIKIEDAFIKLEDLEIAINQGDEMAIIIDRKIRALNPEPGIWTIKENKRMKILEAILTSAKKLKLKKIQFEGKKPILLK